jgi:hypothetical protein
MTKADLTEAWSDLQQLRNQLESHAHSLGQMAKVAREEPATRDGWPQALVTMARVAFEAAALAKLVQLTVCGWIAELDGQSTGDALAQRMAEHFEPHEGDYEPHGPSLNDDPRMSRDI